MHPLVSVVIPNYNHAQYVGDAIGSVLAQDYPNYEIIVVDDGSTDNSREVLAAFGDRIRCIRQDNRGLSAARNTGIRESRGLLVGVLDADDMYESRYLSALVSSLNANPAADGIYCGYRFIDRENNPLPQSEARSIASDKLYSVLLDGCFLVPESVLVRRHCYEGAGLFDESLRSCEDWDMWLRLAKKYQILCSTQLLTRHRILPGSMSTDPLRMLSNRLAVLVKHVGPEPRDDPENGGTGKRAYGRAYLSSCIECLQYGERSQAFQCFRKMSVLCPELLAELDTFYQLGCGNQPKGSMGDLSSLNMRHGSSTLLAMLDEFFTSADIGEKLKRRRRTAYSTAYFALGVLSYGAKDFPSARRFLSHALRMNPAILRAQHFGSLCLKSLLGRSLVARVKSIRIRLSSMPR